MELICQIEFIYKIVHKLQVNPGCNEQDTYEVHEENIKER